MNTQMIPQQSELVTPASKTRWVPRRGMVLPAAILGCGVIQLDISVVNVAGKLPLVFAGYALAAVAGGRRIAIEHPRERPVLPPPHMANDGSTNSPD